MIARGILNNKMLQENIFGLRYPVCKEGSLPSCEALSSAKRDNFCITAYSDLRSSNIGPRPSTSRIPALVW